MTRATSWERDIFLEVINGATYAQSARKFRISLSQAREAAHRATSSLIWGSAVGKGTVSVDEVYEHGYADLRLMRRHAEWWSAIIKKHKWDDFDAQRAKRIETLRHECERIRAYLGELESQIRAAEANGRRYHQLLENNGEEFKDL
jgi:hypothetical protein